jgi:hypothetical protein
MATVRKLRNEDYSIFKFVQSTASGLSNTITVVDAFPYNEFESQTLDVPIVALNHAGSEEEALELGSEAYRRNWEIEIFGATDTQRDEIADAIFQDLGNSIPVKDFSGGTEGDAQPVIEYIIAEDRRMTPVEVFDENARIKYWRMTVSFETVSTSANAP